jgi:hypothetical protein
MTRLAWLLVTLCYGAGDTLSFERRVATRTTTTRRELCNTAAGAAALLALSTPCVAFAPASGAPSLLVPVLACARALDSANVRGGDDGAARRLLQQLRAPPFTDATLPRTDVNNVGNARRPVPTIANLLRRSVKRYEASLSYDAAALSADDKRACFPAPEAACAEALVRADLDERDLFRNGALEALQDLESDLSYWLEGDGSADDGAATDAADGLVAARAALARYIRFVPLGEADAAVAGAAALARCCTAAAKSSSTPEEQRACSRGFQ